jgi:hypothetical protein
MRIIPIYLSAHKIYDLHTCLHINSMFKKSADIPINLQINCESLGDRYDYTLSS